VIAKRYSINGFNHLLGGDGLSLPHAPFPVKYTDHTFFPAKNIKRSLESMKKPVLHKIRAVRVEQP